MNNPWVCIDCGSRQAEAGSCRACAKTDTLDARKEQTRDLMYDVDLRIAQKAEGRARIVGVLIGCVAVVGLWLVPGFWSARSQFFAIPFLVDQWALMALIGFVISKFLEKKLTRRRFPYLDDTQQIVA